ncbi:MAG: Rieske (2Fe-2S) protein [Desulfobia sp.]
MQSEHRRAFFKKGWFWLRLLAVGLLFYPLWRFLRFSTPKKPKLVKVNQRLLPGEIFLDPDFILFRGDNGRVWAVSRICTHLGCRLNYSVEKKLLICPCHASKFTREGRRIAGPAQKNLPRLAVEKMGEGPEDGYIVSK